MVIWSFGHDQGLAWKISGEYQGSCIARIQRANIPPLSSSFGLLCVGGGYLTSLSELKKGDPKEKLLWDDPLSSHIRHKDGCVPGTMYEPFCNFQIASLLQGILEMVCFGVERFRWLAGIPLNNGPCLPWMLTSSPSPVTTSRITCLNAVPCPTAACRRGWCRRCVWHPLEQKKKPIA